MNKTMTWKDLKFWSSPEWKQIKATLAETKSTKLKPAPKDIFRPFIETPLSRVKVMILGGEPPSMMETDGLAYSFPKITGDMNHFPGVLQTIFEEYEHDLGYPLPKTGILKKWATQGVLLWNEVPTAREGYPRVHKDIGWHRLTNEIIETLYLRDPNTVFLLWTPNRDTYIDQLFPEDAKIVDCGSPSLVARMEDFWGSSPFTKTNAFLKAAGKEPIQWRLA